MSVGSILYTIFIRPPRLVLETVFAYVNSLLNQPGLSIVALGVVPALLLWAFFRRSEAALRKEWSAWAALWNDVRLACKAVGGERKAQLRQCGQSLRSKALQRSVLRAGMELLVFLAAYDFLSNLVVLNGVTLGPIRNLANPDGLLTVFGVSVNLLPLIMTALHCASVAFFDRKCPLSVKIARYTMALLLLLLLYNAPSGLVLYWTVFCLFSVVKKALPKKVRPKARKAGKPNSKLFLFAALFLSLLTGLWIPSSVINASPLEFVNSTSFYHPLWYVVSSCCLSFGLFVVWLGAFYWLASAKGKLWFERVLLVLCGVAVVDYVFFGNGLGLLTTTLKYENGLAFQNVEILLNAAVVLAVGALLYWVSLRWRNIARSVVLVGVLALAAMSAVNLIAVGGAMNEYLETAQLRDEGDELTITLSREGENVVVLMLDRAAAHLTPYLLNERPELAEQFSGFIFYDNTVSFGLCTNIASPALYGGYEYTPLEMNKRGDESLESKHNEALKVMPVMFSEAGYDVTVYDPSYAGYQIKPDLSIYDDYPQIKTGVTIGAFNEAYKTVSGAEKITQNRNFFCHSIMKIAPVCIQSLLYDKGNYHHLREKAEATNAMDSTFESYPITSMQMEVSPYEGRGVSSTFLDSYMVLKHLPDMTQITDGETGCFLMMSNDTPHEQTLLQEPEYVPAYVVDNTAYEQENADRYTLDGRSLDMSDLVSMEHYQINMATLLQLGEWFDYLREIGVYDNTRIILVADHNRRGVANMDELHVSLENGEVEDITGYYPLLMVKDFNATGALKTDSTFMTNADVPTLATEGLIENPVNPFTGSAIDSSAKQADKLYIFGSADYDVSINNGNVFLEGPWFSVTENLWDKSNWAYEGYGTYPEGVEP